MLIETLLERTIFHTIRKEIVSRGLLPDIDNYDIENDNLSIVEDETNRYNNDLYQIKQTKGFAIEIFNYASNHYYGDKKPPRIVINTDSYLPGELGTDPSGFYVKTEDGSFTRNKSADILVDYYFNLHLVAESTNQIRELHDIMATCIPRRGYLKPYSVNETRPIGNLFVNYLSNGDVSFLNEGIIEKVYRYLITDVHHIDDKVISEINIPEIKEINVTMNKDVDNELNIN